LKRKITTANVHCVLTKIATDSLAESDLFSALDALGFYKANYVLAAESDLSSVGKFNYKA
jgi:hypothetical protein